MSIHTLIEQRRRRFVGPFQELPKLPDPVAVGGTREIIQQEYNQWERKRYAPNHFPDVLANIEAVFGQKL